MRFAPWRKTKLNPQNKKKQWWFYFVFYQAACGILYSLDLRELISCDWKTLKASPLSSRGSVRPADRTWEGSSTLKGSPIALLGHAFSVLFSLFPLSVGPSDTTATERWRFQRLSIARLVYCTYSCFLTNLQLTRVSCSLVARAT